MDKLPASFLTHRMLKIDNKERKEEGSFSVASRKVDPYVGEMFCSGLKL